MFSDGQSGASLSLNFLVSRLQFERGSDRHSPSSAPMAHFESIVPPVDHGGHSHEPCSEPWHAMPPFSRIYRCFAHAEPVRRVPERIAMHIVSTLFDMSVDASVSAVLNCKKKKEPTMLVHDGGPQQDKSNYSG